jgi:hypothetical protein
MADSYRRFGKVYRSDIHESTSEILLSADWQIVTDVSGKFIGLIFMGQLLGYCSSLISSQLPTFQDSLSVQSSHSSLTLEYGTDRLSLDVSN